MKKLQLAAIILGSVVAAGWLHADTTINPNPSRIVGQPQLTLLSGAPNLVEGREFNAPQGVAADTSVTPPILYVVDTGNNRVLAWRNAAGFASGAFADLVIGQANKFATSALGPGTNVSTGLNSPTGAVVDGKGNLYVVDSGNNRIVRYPKPFDQPADALLPDMVVGQKTFSANSSNEGLSLPTAKTLSLNLGGNNLFRSGLAIDKDGNLYASDPGNNRVLRYPAVSLNAGSNEPAADVVLGQSTFDSKTPQILNGDRTSKTGMATPSGLALDQSGRLFVCDLLNRVLVYLPPFTSSGKSAARVMGVAPQTGPSARYRAVPTYRPKACSRSVIFRSWSTPTTAASCAFPATIRGRRKPPP
jgi:sugar lactone lactonase YvrE